MVFQLTVKTALLFESSPAPLLSGSDYLYNNRCIFSSNVCYVIYFSQEKIRSNYDAIRFRPEHFVDYLLSEAVGFATFEVLEIPQHKASGEKTNYEVVNCVNHFPEIPEISVRT